VANAAVASIKMRLHCRLENGDQEAWLAAGNTVRRCRAVKLSIKTVEAPPVPPHVENFTS